jgi:hypothetical protein
MIMVGHAISLMVPGDYGTIATVLPDRGGRYLSMDLFKY